MSTVDATRIQLSQRLHEEAARRWGADRAAALGAGIQTLAGHLAELAQFPLSSEDAPAVAIPPEA